MDLGAVHWNLLDPFFEKRQNRVKIMDHTSEWRTMEGECFSGIIIWPPPLEHTPK